MDIKIKIKEIGNKILKNKDFLELEKKFFQYIKTYEKENLKENFWFIDFYEKNFTFLEKSFSLILWSYEKSRYSWKKFSIRFEQKIFNNHLKEQFLYVLELDNNFEYNDEFLIF